MIKNTKHEMDYFGKLLAQKGASTHKIKVLIDIFREKIKDTKFNDTEQKFIEKYITGYDPKNLDYENTLRGIQHIIEDLGIDISTNELNVEVNSILKKEKNEVERAGFIYDENELPQEIHSVMGIYKGYRYYGMLIPKNETKTIQKKEGSYTIKLIKNKLCLITEDHLQHEINRVFCDSKKIVVSESPLLKKNRWELSKIKLWLDKKEDYEFNILDLVKNKYKNSLYYKDNRWYLVHAIWDIGTYFFDLFNQYPYIENTGLKGTAKTKSMLISEKISFNGKYFLKPTAPTLFRYVQRNRPSLYIDEAESLFKTSRGKTEQSDIVELINGGFQKGASVPRWERNPSGNFVLEEFNSYCPKQIASIKGLSSSGALQSRCITHVHIKAPVKDKRSEYWPTEDDPFYNNIRNQIYCWALKNWKKVIENYKTIEKEFKLENRDWDLWHSLLSVIRVFSEDYYKELGEFAEEITETSDNTSFETDKWEYKVIEILISLVSNSETQHCKITVEGIKTCLKEEASEKDFIPNNTMIGSFVSSIGFKDYRKRGNPNYYLLSKSVVREILETQNILTQVTLLTLFNAKIEDNIT